MCLPNHVISENQQFASCYKLFWVESCLSGCFIKGDLVFKPTDLMVLYMELSRSA